MTTTEGTFDRLKKIIVDQLSVEDSEVKPTAKFSDDLGADSLDLVEMVLAIEEQFDVKIAEEEAEKLLTVQDAVDCLEKLGAKEA